MTGGYPDEKPLDNIWIYHPENDSWKAGPKIPKERLRGSAGVVLYSDKIYIAGGIKFGHSWGTTNYFDSFDPKTGKWEILTDAPHVRDHFSAIVANERLYCIGGRNTSVHHQNNFEAFFDAVIQEVDVYDFQEKKWITLNEPLPVPTAAGGIVSLDNLIIYMGGEGKLSQAYNFTQCYDLSSGKWTFLSPLFFGRHGTNAVVYNNKIYLAAGSPVKGGENLSSIEYFSTDHSWEKLFNGYNLEGWIVKCQEKDKHHNFWKVDNGAILGNSVGSTEHDYVWLQTDKEYKNFELRLKFKVSKISCGNSGVQIRSRYDDQAVMDDPTQKGWLDGPQIDIDPCEPWRIGLVYDETRTIRRWIYPSLKDWEIKEHDSPLKRTIFYWENENYGWNDLTIICNNTCIKTYLNNILVSDFNGSGILNDDAHLSYKVGLNGYIALQIHKNSQIKVWFEDIEIRKLAD